MLEIKNIKKDYQLKDQEPVHALKGISLKFRKNEFTAILGHSGCGKTTLLNIIGGLDHYDDGDLIIKGKSTKNFKDGDWDTYRNHSIGFVFQSYNLISHQTILKNVELALTISGVSKEERVARAKKALDMVGLHDLYNKKPNQLSGGQMQRVAIARALVNNPEIVLADEPTGALDSETSIQIMDILKEVAKDHLVIMVTHNPELADAYATRIVRMKDGEILSDSNPYDGEYVESEVPEVSKGRKKQSSMSFFTATGLSVSNLWSKFKRTALVAIAGSIGIIGVSTILGVSVGVNNYIYDMQDDMLSSYPITISEESVDMTSLLTGLASQDKKELAKFDTSTKVGVDSMIAYLMTKYSDFTNVKTNDINEDLLTYIAGMPSEYYSAMSYDYSIDPTNNFFTAFKRKTDGEKEIISFNGLTQQYIETLMHVEGFKEYATFVDLFTNFMNQLPGEQDYILSQYDLLGNSRFPTAQNELLLVVDDKTTLTDLILAQMGYYPQDQFLNIAKKAVKENDAYKALNAGDITQQQYDALVAYYDEKYQYDQTFNIDDILNHEFYYYPHNAIYKETPDFVSHNQATISLKGNGSGFLTGWTFILGLNYDSGNDALTGSLIAIDGSDNIQMNQSIILYRQTEYDTTKSVADGKWSISYQGQSLDLEIDTVKKPDDPEKPNTHTFDASGSLKTSVTMGSMTIPVNVTLDKGTITEIEPTTPDYWYNAALDQTSQMYLDPASVGGTTVKVVGILRAKESTQFGSLSRGVYYTKEFANEYRRQAIESVIGSTFKDHIINKNYTVSQFNAYVKFTYDDYENLDEYGNPTPTKGYRSALNGDTGSTLTSIFASFMSGGKDNLKNDKLHLRALTGYKVVDYQSEVNPSEIDHHEIKEFPQRISIYPKNFKNKNGVTSYLDDWNKDAPLPVGSKILPKDQRPELTYNDTISLIISVISTLVNVISAALIAFTSLSLVVSCFMIAVITYISVMERIKEIGVIRSLGGRKKDVSRLFIAENLITGFASGAFGIFITYLLQVIINAIVSPFGVTGICALPWYYALMMIGIAVFLSVMSGLIPSMSASKQDPVIALRTE